VIRLACWKPRFANRTGAHLGPSNRATALDGARCAPTPLAGGARAGLAAVRAQYAAAARLLTPSVASHQRAARTSWRGPIDTLQFFHSGQQLRTDDSARRDVQNTQNLAFAAPIFSLWPQHHQQLFFICERHYPDALGAGDGTAKARRGTHGSATARAIDVARNGPRDSRGARQKRPCRGRSGCYARDRGWGAIRRALKLFDM
jgi:hypothetical protein